jgi:RNA polymerase sigma-70 factor (ECF subfamily)
VERIEEQLEQLYGSTFLRMRRSVFALVGDWEEAAEVVQDAFAQAWMQRASFRGDGSLEGWVWRVAMRLAARRGSQTRRRHALLGTLAPALPPGDRVPELLEAFAELPPRRRLLVVLRYVGGLSHAEIAEATGLRVGTVAGALSKARRQLVATLEAKGVAP